jgi:hypothetical protein
MILAAASMSMTQRQLLRLERGALFLKSILSRLSIQNSVGLCGVPKLAHYEFAPDREEIVVVVGDIIVCGERSGELVGEESLVELGREVVVAAGLVLACPRCSPDDLRVAGCEVETGERGALLDSVENRSLEQQIAKPQRPLMPSFSTLCPALPHTPSITTSLTFGSDKDRLPTNSLPSPSTQRLPPMVCRRARCRRCRPAPRP